VKNQVYIRAARMSSRAQAMASKAQRQVVILYEHALLGEGLARYVQAQTGLEATVVRAHDFEAVQSALASRPPVVIFELSEPLEQGDLAILAPDAVLIDVSTVVTRGFAVCAVGLERIRQVVCGIGSTRSRPAPRRRRDDAVNVMPSALHAGYGRMSAEPQLGG
jgi:hypothetical protein